MFSGMKTNCQLHHTWGKKWFTKYIPGKHIKYLQRLRSMFMGVFEERERGDSPGKGVAGGAHGTSIPQSLTTPDCFSDK